VYNDDAVGAEHADFVAVTSDPADYSGAWITITFEAGETTIDRMAYANRHASESNAAVLLEFSDGSNQTVSGLLESHERAVFDLAPVTTSFVKITALSAHGTAGGKNVGAREIHFYPPGGTDFELQGRLHMSVGSWDSLPRGCSYQSGGDNAAHWNSHEVGCGGPNCGGYTSVLGPGSENVFMPSQSSRHSYGPYEAVDGKTGAEWNHWGSQSCVRTSAQTSPWYQLDLGSVQNITTIVYHARTCGGECNTDMFGFNVYVDNILYASNVQAAPGQVRRFPIFAAGRVVKIMNPGDEQVVTFCELEVNVAQSPDAAGHYISRPAAEAQALKHTLKLLAIAPDFHTTNVHHAKPKVREPPPAQVSEGRSYKAVVVVFLGGGADSYNIVVPHGGDGASTDCKKPRSSTDGGGGGGGVGGGGRGRKAATVEFEPHDLYAEYRLERGAEQALAKAELLAVEVPGDAQPCTTFGLHPSLKNIHQLYNDGDAALVANMGGLVEPLTLEDWNARNNAGAKKLPPGVFGHNVMQKNAWTVHAENRDAKGMLGRMVTKFANKSSPMKSAMYSLSGYQRMLTGAPFAPDIINAGEGIVRFGDYGNLAAEIAEMTGHESESLLVRRSLIPLVPVYHSFPCTTRSLIPLVPVYHSFPCTTRSSYLLVSLGSFWFLSFLVVLVGFFSVQLISTRMWLVTNRRFKYPFDQFPLHGLGSSEPFACSARVLMIRFGGASFLAAQPRCCGIGAGCMGQGGIGAGCKGQGLG
jgi:hypothetical protein